MIREIIDGISKKEEMKMTVRDLLEEYIVCGTIIEIYFQYSHVEYHGNISDLADTIPFIWYKNFILEVKNDVLIIVIIDMPLYTHKQE